ncbi:MAG: O-antigen ligase family protein [Xanthobacteraceae bacterium]
MSATFADVLALDRAAARVPRLRYAAQPLRNGLLWLTGASGALVFIEPSPYEIVSLIAMMVFVGTRLGLRPGLLPLAAWLVLINIGFSISATPFMDDRTVVNWLLTSWFMAISALFFAAVLSENTAERIAFLTRGYVVAGVIAALAAIIGYSRIFHGLDDLLLLYDRARGTFKDPNVLGAFLVLPALISLQRVLMGTIKDALRGGVLLLLFSAAIFLSFSRGAWGVLVFTAALMMLLMFLTTRSTGQRLRIVMVGFAGIAVVALFIAALLSIDVVAALFKERAQLEQSYDMGQTGRFGRHALGALLALDKPFGIGPLQFSHYFPEDTHNSYLNAFMSGGWLSGAVYPTLIAVTLLYGLRQVFVPTPWRATYLAYYAAFAGLAAESFVIDSDHWRHYFLCIGVLWGLFLAARPSARTTSDPQPVGAFA